MPYNPQLTRLLYCLFFILFFFPQVSATTHGRLEASTTFPI